MVRWLSRMASDAVDRALQTGENARVEFKEAVSILDREMVAFANSGGGSVFIGVTDTGVIKGVRPDNRLLSRIQDIARNCDPSVTVEIFRHGSVIELRVPRGDDKPYRCKDGFFLRVGPNSQKLRRDEIVDLLFAEGKIHFDERFARGFDLDADLSRDRVGRYLEFVTDRPPAEDPETLLTNLKVAIRRGTTMLVKNAAVLFFAKDPQKFYPESHTTCVRYEGDDRYEIVDRQDIRGSLIEQIDGAVGFFRKHSTVRYLISGDSRRREVFAYPPAAIREAITNAIMHWDYSYGGSHVYLHMFRGHLEVENPGGLPRGMTVEELGKRSVRRNPLIANLLLRAGYAEELGSGIDRMRRALAENGNPPFEVSATSFFVIRLMRRPPTKVDLDLSARQHRLIQFLEQAGAATSASIADRLQVSVDTALRDVNALIDMRVVEREGTGRATRYRIRSSPASG